MPHNTTLNQGFSKEAILSLRIPNSLACCLDGLRPLIQRPTWCITTTQGAENELGIGERPYLPRHLERPCTRPGRQLGEMFGCEMRGPSLQQAIEPVCTNPPGSFGATLLIPGENKKRKKHVRLLFRH